jgi:ribosomal protein S27E
MRDNWTTLLHKIRVEPIRPRGLVRWETPYDVVNFHLIKRQCQNIQIVYSIQDGAKIKVHVCVVTLTRPFLEIFLEPIGLLGLVRWETPYDVVNFHLIKRQCQNIQIVCSIQDGAKIKVHV